MAAESCESLLSRSNASLVDVIMKFTWPFACNSWSEGNSVFLPRNCWNKSVVEMPVQPSCSNTAVMLRRKFCSAVIKYLMQAIGKWDGVNQDLAQIYNAFGVSYVRDGKLEIGITQFDAAVKLKPGYITAWKFEGVLLFYPDNKVARPLRAALRDRVTMYKEVPVISRGK